MRFLMLEGLVLSARAVAGATCCSQLSEAFGTALSFPGQASYNATESSYWSLQESHLEPACVLKPASAQDVSTAVSILTASDCKFAVKGQGHAPAAGFANIEGGVTIDMTSLGSSVLSADRSVVSVGAGANWLSVYEFLDPYGLAVAGGRNGLVGVGGLTIGGGISHFSPRFGWTCDNVVNFEVVLASGLLVNVNESSNSELYRALKGGANNFGVVTRFDLATFAQGNISVTSLVNDIAQREAVFEAFTDITTAPDFDIYTSLVTGLLFNSTSKSWLISNSAVYTRDVSQPAVFSKLVAVPSISNKSMSTTLASFANEAPTGPLNWVFATATFKPSPELMLEIFDALNTTLYSFNPAGGIVWDVAFEPLPSVMLAYSDARGGNALGLSGEDGDSFVLLLSALWPDSTSNSDVERIARTAISSLECLASTKGMLRKFQYLNYAAPYQRPLVSYGSQSLTFLETVSSTYDPSKVFQRLLIGGFKLD